MTTHKVPLGGPSIVPWEPLGQISPCELPDPSDTYPGPWSAHHRGNGHYDIVDGRGMTFAHVYVYDSDDGRELTAKIAASKATP